MSEFNAMESSSSLSTVNLVRSSHPWTEADNAAGFVLRYLGPMRRQLTAILGNPELADAALKLLITHLVSAGFGEHKQGRLRDFLLRAIRSAAKTAVSEVPDAQRPQLNLDEVTLESKQWLSFWREGLLERAWRSLERSEHATTGEPVYTILQNVTAKTSANVSDLRSMLNEQLGLELTEQRTATLIAQAKTLFAQLIADEVAETMENPNTDDVKREIGHLGLGKAFAGIAV